MIDMNLWLHFGTKVKIINKYFMGRTGTIKQYNYITGDYIVIMDDGKMLPFRRNEFEVEEN